MCVDFLKEFSDQIQQFPPPNLKTRVVIGISLVIAGGGCRIKPPQLIVFKYKFSTLSREKNFHR